NFGIVRRRRRLTGVRALLGPDQAQTAEQNGLGKQHSYHVSFHRFTSSKSWMVETRQRMARKPSGINFPKPAAVCDDRSRTIYFSQTTAALSAALSAPSPTSESSCS